MPVVNNVVYKDFDTLFAAHPVTGKLNTLTNNSAVARALKNLILTNKGERPYQPMLGSDVTAQLFELNDGLVESNLDTAITEVIKNYEPRAELLSVFVDAENDQHLITVDITFRVVNQIDPITINVMLERIR